MDHIEKLLTCSSSPSYDKEKCPNENHWTRLATWHVGGAPETHTCTTSKAIPPKNGDGVKFKRRQVDKTRNKQQGRSGLGISEKKRNPKSPIPISGCVTLVEICWDLFKFPQMFSSLCYLSIYPSIYNSIIIAGEQTCIKAAHALFRALQVHWGFCSDHIIHRPSKVMAHFPKNIWTKKGKLVFDF